MYVCCGVFSVVAVVQEDQTVVFFSGSVREVGAAEKIVDEGAGPREQVV